MTVGIAVGLAAGLWLSVWLSVAVIVPLFEEATCSASSFGPCSWAHRASSG
jgi:hypothetical protein